MDKAKSILDLRGSAIRIAAILMVASMLLTGCNLQLTTPGQATGTATATSGAQAGQSTEGLASSATLTPETVAPTPTPNPNSDPRPAVTSRSDRRFLFWSAANCQPGCTV